MGDFNVIESMSNMAFGSDLIADMNRVLNFDISAALESIKIISEIAQPIAAVILCFYLVLEIFEKMTDGNFTIEQFLKILVKLAFGQFLITNSTAFVLQFMNVGVSFMNRIAANISTEMPNVIPNVSELGLIDTVILLFALAIPAFVGFIIQIGLKILGYTRNLEMILRAMFAPIGVADVMHGGVNSHGIRYLKDCLAVALQGAIMMGILFAATAIMRGVIGSLGDDGYVKFSVNFFISYFGVMGGVLGMMGQAKSIAREIVG